MTDVSEKNPTLTENDASATNLRTERRRSSSPRLEMPVLISLPKETTYRECKLVQVSGMRAHLLASASLEIGQEMVLTNPKSSKQVACRIGYVRNRNGVFHVGVEFTADPRDFWDFTIPSSDSDSIQQSSGAAGSSSFLSNVPPNPEGPTDLTAEMIRVNPGEAAALIMKRWRILKWAALALAGFMGMYFLFAARFHESTSGSATTGRSILQDIAPEQASLIPDLENYRLATTSDFNPQASAWVANSGKQLGGEFQCAFSLSDQSQVYLLIGKDGVWRIVILSSGKLRYDAKYNAITIVTLLSKQAVLKVRWTDPLPAVPEGNGLLLIRSPKEIGSAAVLFSQGDQIVSRTPSDYRQIPIN
jgi:hypothetical protein